MFNIQSSVGKNNDYDDIIYNYESIVVSELVGNQIPWLLFHLTAGYSTCSDELWGPTYNHKPLLIFFVLLARFQFLESDGSEVGFDKCECLSLTKFAVPLLIEGYED